MRSVIFGYLLLQTSNALAPLVLRLPAEFDPGLYSSCLHSHSDEACHDFLLDFTGLPDISAASAFVTSSFPFTTRSTDPALISATLERLNHLSEAWELGPNPSVESTFPFWELLDHPVLVALAQCKARSFWHLYASLWALNSSNDSQGQMAESILDSLEEIVHEVLWAKEGVALVVDDLCEELPPDFSDSLKYRNFRTHICGRNDATLRLKFANYWARRAGVRRRSIADAYGSHWTAMRHLRGDVREFEISDLLEAAWLVPVEFDAELKHWCVVEKLQDGCNSLIKNFLKNVGRSRALAQGPAELKEALHSAVDEHWPLILLEGEPPVQWPRNVFDGEYFDEFTFDELITSQEDQDFRVSLERGFLSQRRLFSSLALISRDSLVPRFWTKIYTATSADTLKQMVKELFEVVRQVTVITAIWRGA